MKTLVAAIIGLALATFASPATAYVAEITTSISLTNMTDEAQLKQAIESAVGDVLKRAIAFTPTVVAVQNARVVGDRIYILLLIADEDGEKTMETFSAADPERSGPAREGEPSEESPSHF